MFLQLEAVLRGDFFLPPLDLRIEKLHHPTAVQAHQMVVVRAFVDLEHRLARLEVTAQQNAGLLELGQHAVHRGQTDVLLLVEQHAVHIFRSHVALRALLKNLQNAQARLSDFQTGIAQTLCIALSHGGEGRIQ